MKICLVGKYPPIAGGVSTRTYAYAHALARRGHEVHVITNADEVAAPHRMFMREEDWQRCEGVYDRGMVRVHWSSPFDRRQFHIPAANPFVTKLASVGIEVARSAGAEVVFSFYMEPYAVAGHLIAEASGLPHVVRPAGSDAGRLWRHPQFKPIYDHIFRSAAAVIAGGAVAGALVEAGVEPARLRPAGTFRLDEYTFSPEGPVLDVPTVLEAARSDPNFSPLCWGHFCPKRRYFGVYGKLGEKKGTPALLQALAVLKAQCPDAGLLIMGQQQPHVPSNFRARAAGLGLADMVVQIPFLPNWWVPEFIRRCLAICCLEQDFPISFHQPLVAREAMTCGACVVASTQVLRKLPFADRVVHGYNAVAIEDATDAGELANRLAAILARPELVPVVGARAGRLTADYQRNMAFPDSLEHALAAAVAGGRTSAGMTRPAETFRPDAGRAEPARRPSPAPPGRAPIDPLFRLSANAWAMDCGDLDVFVPTLASDIDIAPAGIPGARPAAGGDDGHTASALIDGQTASVLGLCNGVRTVAEIVRTMASRQPDTPRMPNAIRASVMALFKLGVLALNEHGAAKPKRTKLDRTGRPKHPYRRAP